MVEYNNDYNLLNAYLQLVYGNPLIFMNYVFEENENYGEILQWLHHHGIYLNFLEEMTDDKFMIFKNMIYAPGNKDKEKRKEIYESLHIDNLKEDIKKIKNMDKTLVILCSDYKDNDVNRYFISNDALKQSDKIQMFHRRSLLDKEDLSFYGLHQYFKRCLFQIDRWPGVAVIKNGDFRFISVNSLDEYDKVYGSILDESVFDQMNQIYNDSYFVHLSDLHLGTKKHEKGKEALYRSLDGYIPYIDSFYPIKFTITGDLMNTPNRKNMYIATEFMNQIRKRFYGDITFVLGNHDVITHGLNFGNWAKTKVIAYLLGDSLKILEQEKLIIVKVNSNVEGNLARGKVGKQQMKEIDEELSTIRHLEDYDFIVMVHHHIMLIPRDAFLKSKLKESFKFIEKFIDKTKVLIDSEEFLAWMRKNNMKVALNGHRHLPYFINKDGVYVVTAGAACGGDTKEKNSSYISYNLLKYDHNERRMKFCFIIYDDITSMDRQRIKVKMF